jgi:hypothetical protein
LRTKIDLAIGPWAAACRRLAAHPRLPEVWPEYLITTHTIIRSTVPIMQMAEERARVLASDDPVAVGVAAYFDAHADEEKDHDLWLLEDLELIGVDRDVVLARVPSPAVASLVGAQYYWILHYHPVTLLGYIAVLEGYPPTGAMIDALVARTGYERDAFRTLSAHGELDPHHREELDEALDSLPLTPEQSTAVGTSAMYTVHMLTRAIDEILDKAAEDLGPPS